MLRMVEETVRERSETVILNFNPWLFSGTDQLVTRFLDELAAQLRDASTKAGATQNLKRVGDQLTTYAESLEPLAWLPVLGPWLGRVGTAGRVINSLRKARNKQPSADKQRELVRDDLRSLEHRVLVTIDDLDRIEPAQIRDMVRLVKLIGDFPNVTYLLSYDREPVARAVGDDISEGEAYLEKIVQVVHDLPEPPLEAVIRIFLEELQSIVDSAATGLFSEEDWQNVFPAGMRPFFRTLRDVRRYLNAVPVTLRVVGREVALVDVLALETIRVFLPRAYTELTASVAALTGEGRRGLGQAQARDAADAARVSAIVEVVGTQQAATKELLARLFPNIGHLVGGSRVVVDEQRARQRLRVADPGVFRAYLQRAMPHGVISGALVHEAVASLGDRERLSEVFANLEPDLAEGLIQRLEDYEHDYDVSSVEPAIEVLLNQLPRLREGQRGMLDMGPDLTVGRVVLRLLRRVGTENERLQIVERVLPRLPHLTTRMELIDTVGHRENVGHELVSKEASDRLYRDLNEQIKGAAPDRLAHERGLVHLFVPLAQGNGASGVEAIRHACESDEVLLQLLRGGLGEQRSQTVGDYAVRSRPSLPWELYEEWLGADQLRRRVGELAERTETESLPMRTKAALEAAQKYVSGELSNERFREGWGDAE